jgi:hypothetical protein
MPTETLKVCGWQSGDSFLFRGPFNYVQEEKGARLFRAGVAQPQDFSFH